MKKIFSVILFVLLLAGCSVNSAQQPTPTPKPTGTPKPAASIETVGTFSIITSHIENEVIQDPEGSCHFPERIFKGSLEFDEDQWEEWEDFNVIMEDYLTGKSAKFSFKLLESGLLEIENESLSGEGNWKQIVELYSSNVIPMGIERSNYNYLVQGPLYIHRCESKVFVSKQYVNFQAEILIMPGNDFMIPQEWKKS